MYDLYDLIRKITEDEDARVEKWLEFCSVTVANANECWLGVDRQDATTTYRLYRNDILIGSYEFKYSIKE